MVGNQDFLLHPKIFARVSFLVQKILLPEFSSQPSTRFFFFTRVLFSFTFCRTENRVTGILSFFISQPCLQIFLEFFSQPPMLQQRFWRKVRARCISSVRVAGSGFGRGDFLLVRRLLQQATRAGWLLQPQDNFKKACQVVGTEKGGNTSRTN